MTKFPEVSIDEVLAKLPAGAEARALVQRAYEFAEAAHRGQLRKSGEAYIHHPLQVAFSLAEMRFDPTVIAAGLLHDVLEDCDVTREQLAETFGREIFTLVEGVTKLEGVEEWVKQDLAWGRDLQELESLRKMFIAMAEDDVRVIFIKLADRLHNMRTLAGLTPENQQRMARETLQIFAPIANRLGIWLWKAELEDLAFRNLDPKMYEELARLLDARKGERQVHVDHHIKMLEETLSREEIAAKIKGRPKHIYSIYLKMRRKNIPFSRVYDAEGLRVMVETVPQCYQVLGIVHNLWTPVPGEFDDYIANPKPNGYQSLHTAVIGEDGAAFEIQIRTSKMDFIAEFGVAAHWRYKEQGAPVDDRVIDQIAQMRQSVQELRQDSGDAQDFIKTMRSDVFQDRVYVFTPKGRVIDLPAGATPLDFAYHIHTEIGHRCRGARVNGRWTPLNYQLRTGEQVQIITGRTGGPSRDWLNEELGFVKTSRATQKIKQWFRQEGREQNISLGWAIVEQEIKRLGLSWTIDEVYNLFSKHFQRREDFLAAVGVADITSERIVNRIEDVLHREGGGEELPEPEIAPPPPPQSVGKVVIQGAGELLTRVALCCKPLPGEEIIGYVTRGRGVTIHRRDCPNILRLELAERDRLIEMDWGNEEETFAVQVIVTAYDRSALLRDITALMGNEGVNIVSVKTGKRDRYNILPIYLTLEVPNLRKLNRVLGKAEQIPNVIEARRSV